MRYYLTLTGCLLLSLVKTEAFAQKQTNIWYFGGKGLDFNFTPPRVLTDNAMKSSEGVASIADENGKLLFYTNGEAIWNKNHVMMANGSELAGNISSRQGALIIPQPGSESLYYVFTTDSFEKKWAQGLRYSLVDMSRQGDLGEVVRKNVFLQPLAEENLTATGSCNCPSGSKQYWLAADRADEPGYLYAYRIDDKGVYPYPEISLLPGVLNITYLKFSPAGNQIAFTGLNTAQESIIGLADFDQETGIFSNLKLFPEGRKDDYHRALEFSGNGKVLYFIGWSPGIIVQYDITQPNVDKIVTSAIVLTEPKYSYITAPQLASDGKIYVATDSGSPSEFYFSAIEHPNLLGVASSFKLDALDHVGGLMAPNFVTSFLYHNDTLRLNLNAGLDQSVCGTAAVQLGGKASKSLTYRWSPGNFLSDSTAPSPVFKYTLPVEKEITLQYVLTATDSSCVRRDTVQVTVYPLLQATLTGSRSVCPGVTDVTYQINSSAPEGQTYRWRVNGGIIRTGQGTAAITVDWGTTNATARVEVIPVSAQGCAGAPTVLPVRINVELDTETPKGLTEVCANQPAGNIYRVTNTNGSVYTWGVTGGTLTSGQGTAQVTVNWQGLGDHRIWLQEQSTTRDTVCFGASDTLRINVYQDPTTLALRNVSVDSANEQRIIVNWAASNASRLAARVTIFRRALGAAEWQQAGTVTPNELVFTDQGLKTDEQIYEYRVEGQNGCGETIASLAQHTILLTGETAANGQIKLEWNAFIGWQAGVERYEIWRQLDNEPTLKLIGQVTDKELTFASASSLDGFDHHFRIRAIARNAAYTSWSNDLALTYAHELIVPNVFTPNNDGVNETFAIPLLELYPDNQFAVYNRWGQPVFSTTGYHNNWSAERLTAGTYYYSLLLRRTGKLLKGWVEITK